MLSSGEFFILLVLVALAIVSALVNALMLERNRNAILGIRDIVNGYSLADLKMRKAAMKESLQLRGEADVKRTLEQIVLNATGVRHLLDETYMIPGRSLAISSSNAGGASFYFVPNDKAFLAEHPEHKKLRLYELNGIGRDSSDIFVTEKLHAVAKALNADAAIPETEQWYLFMLEAKRFEGVKQR